MGNHRSRVPLNETRLRDRIASMVLAAVLALLLLPALTAAPIEVRWVQTASATSPAAHAEVRGLTPSQLRTVRSSRWSTDDWQQLFPVHTEIGTASLDPDLPPMLGAYEVRDEMVRFTPRFPLQRGVRYAATFRPSRLAQGTKLTPGNALSITARFQLPDSPTHPVTRIESVFPTAETVPENLLKFYLHFSGPMRRGHIYDHIHLRDKDGKSVELPFLEIDEELWNPEMTRLTLFLDPGRIKRGVRPLEEVGPALEAGRAFTLRIDPAWLDAEGRPLTGAFEKHFTVTAADRDPPTPARWTIEPPSARATTPLRVRFDEPIDHALALRMIRVLNADGKLVEGAASLSDHERLWQFQPRNPWTAGAHTLSVQTTIEDLAGNNIGKPFEVDLFDTVQRKLTAETVRIPFEIR